jgi:hypothetical protein
MIGFADAGRKSIVERFREEQIAAPTVDTAAASAPIRSQISTWPAKFGHQVMRR